MKKNIVISLMLMLAMPTFAESNEDGAPLNFSISMSGDNNGGNGNLPFPKSPILVPSVSQDSHTLYLYSGCIGTTIQLLDEDETVIFSHFIEENETLLALPSNLSGTYELQIIRGNITFYAFIEL